MKRVFIRWVLLAVSVFAASLLCQALGLGFQANANGVSQFFTLMIGVALLAFLNVTMGKLLKLITLPLSCLTLGLFSLVVNAAVLYFASRFELGFKIVDDGIKGFAAAFVASLLISAINGALGVFLPDEKE
ncbi:MAG: phage holin family protein [Fimbriimonas sp.]|nr:phage holin family protein [Fimbriimonas sp.]